MHGALQSPSCNEDAASLAGIHPGALIKMRWAVTREDTGDQKATLVVLGYTDPGLGQIWGVPEGCP